MSIAAILDRIERSDYDVFEQPRYGPAGPEILDHGPSHGLAHRAVVLWRVLALVPQAIQDRPLATLAGLVPHYLAFYLFGIAALDRDDRRVDHGPYAFYLAVPILQTLGPWAKPFAVTGRSGHCSGSPSVV